MAWRAAVGWAAAEGQGAGAVGTEPRRGRRQKEREGGRQAKAYSTRYSQAVSHPSTNQARPCLASEIRRDRARSGWYGRRHRDLAPAPQEPRAGLPRERATLLGRWGVASAPASTPRRPDPLARTGPPPPDAAGLSGGQSRPAASLPRSPGPRHHARASPRPLPWALPQASALWPPGTDSPGPDPLASAHPPGCPAVPWSVQPRLASSQGPRTPRARAPRPQCRPWPWPWPRPWLRPTLLAGPTGPKSRGANGATGAHQLQTAATLP